MNRTKRLLSVMLLAVGMATGASALDTDTDGYYLIGSVQDWQDFAAIVNNQVNTKANAKAVRRKIYNSFIRSGDIQREGEVHADGGSEGILLQELLGRAVGSLFALFTGMATCIDQNNS